MTIPFSWKTIVLYSIWNKNFIDVYRRQRALGRTKCDIRYKGIIDFKLYFTLIDCAILFFSRLEKNLSHLRLFEMSVWMWQIFDKQFVNSTQKWWAWSTKSALFKSNHQMWTKDILPTHVEEKEKLEMSIQPMQQVPCIFSSVWSWTFQLTQILATSTCMRKMSVIFHRNQWNIKIYFVCIA